MRIVFTGGGTGGHVFPIIAVARELRRLKPDAELIYVGPKGLGAELFHNDEIHTYFIFGGKLHRFFTPMLILEPFKLFFGFIGAFWKMFWLMPDIVLAKGGFGALPVVLAARFHLIPVYLHESDAVAGLANRITAPFAQKIFTAFPPPPSWGKKATVVGNPVRASLAKGDPAAAEADFALTKQKPVVLVLGGSQGARQINDLVITVLKDILLVAEVVHQCGEQNYDEVQNQTKVELTQDLAPYYHLVPFLGEFELANAYAAADIVVSRAGSGSIFEIALARKPSILIPLLGAAQEHQRANARIIADANAALALDSPNLTPHLFLAELRKLLDSPQERERLAKNAASFARPDAAALIAQELLR